MVTFVVSSPVVVSTIAWLYRGFL